MPENQENNFFHIIETNIRQFAKQQRITLSELSSSIGMTEAGFYKMLSTESIKVKTLKRISEVLKHPIEAFFQDHSHPYQTDAPLSIAAEPEAQYQTEKDTLEKQIKLLESQIADKNKIIELLTKK